MSIHQRIAAGEYRNALEYPDRPNAPAVLNKRAVDLTKDEAASLSTVKEQHGAALDAFANARDAYHTQDHLLATKFHADLEAEHGMTGHPKAALLYAKAYERGHSNGGFINIAIEYADLVELVR